MALALMRLAARAPLALLHAIGVVLGWVACGSRTYRRDLRRNLALAGYEHDRRVRRAAIGEAGKMVAEAPRIILGPRAEMLGLVRAFEGREHIDAARAAGRGIVYLTPHFGCFELAGQALNELGPLTALYRRPKIAWLGTLLEQRRNRPDAHLAPADLSGVRTLLAALKRGEAVIILPDQVPGRGEGVWAEFFGKPAYTMTLAARLAERNDSVCLVVTAERLPRGKGFTIRVRPLPAALPGESSARRINRALEEAIRARPEQYLWGYNRYKRPAGAEPPSALSRVALALVWLAHFLPARALAALGGALGALAFWLIPERRRVTRINLEKCFPLMDPSKREWIARAHFRAAGRSIFDLGVLWWAPRARVERMVRIEGLEHLRALGATPSILLAPHFVGVDIGGSRLGAEVNMVSMYAAQKDRMLSEMLLHGRRRFGTHKLVSRQEGIRAVIAGMREGLPFYYLPDQDYGPRDALFVPFFGIQTATVPGLARIARLVGAKVLPCVTRLLPPGEGYLLTIEPAWENFPTADAAADTRRMNEYIERKALEMPEQYLWMHKRFKTRPPGEARFYPED